MGGGLFVKEREQLKYLLSAPMSMCEAKKRRALYM